jgi:lipopolysaccharide transport protein LptA
MSSSLPELSRRGFVLALAAAGFVKLLPASAAALPREELNIQGNNFRGNPRDGTFSLDDVELRQGKDTLIRAKTATVLDEDRTLWDLTGNVHVEFRGAVLDADKARLVLTENRELSTVNVQGAPARFSHRPPGNSNRQNLGRANNIDYDAATSKVRMSGDSWYSDGDRIEASAKTAIYIYDMKEGGLVSTSDGTGSGRTQIILRERKHVPTPRTPERSTSQ